MTHHTNDDIRDNKKDDSMLSSFLPCLLDEYTIKFEGMSTPSDLWARRRSASLSDAPNQVCLVSDNAKLPPSQARRRSASAPSSTTRSTGYVEPKYHCEFDRDNTPVVFHHPGHLEDHDFYQESEQDDSYEDFSTKSSPFIIHTAINILNEDIIVDRFRRHRSDRWLAYEKNQPALYGGCIHQHITSGCGDELPRSYSRRPSL